MLTIKFENLENSIIPTISDAVSEKTREFEKFSESLEGRNAMTIHLRTLYDVIECLRSGLCHFYMIGELSRANLPVNEERLIHIKNHAAEFEEIWGNIENAIISEVVPDIIPELGVFLSETPRPRALMGINFLLDAQFHITADPSIFLVRHLMTRILLAAYIASIPASIKSGSIEMIRNVPLENKWRDSQDLRCAAILHSDTRFAPEHFAFRTVLCRELCLLENLFELVLRQLSKIIVQYNRLGRPL